MFVVCPSPVSPSLFPSILLCLLVLPLTLSPFSVLGLYYSSRKSLPQYHDSLLFLIPRRIKYCKISLITTTGYPFFLLSPSPIVSVFWILLPKSTFRKRTLLWSLYPSLGRCCLYNPRVLHSFNQELLHRLFHWHLFCTNSSISCR